MPLKKNKWHGHVVQDLRNYEWWGKVLTKRWILAVLTLSSVSWWTVPFIKTLKFSYKMRVDMNWGILCEVLLQVTVISILKPERLSCPKLRKKHTIWIPSSHGQAFEAGKISIHQTKHQGRGITAVSLSQWNNEVKSFKSTGKDGDTWNQKVEKGREKRKWFLWCRNNPLNTI